MLIDSDELEARLTRWANWARGPSIGSASTAVGYMRERLDRGADSQEMTDEIAITERAIARTKLEDRAYWRVIAKYYLGSLALVEIANFYHTSETGIKSLFLRAKGRVADNIYQIERNGLTYH